MRRIAVFAGRTGLAMPVKGKNGCQMMATAVRATSIWQPTIRSFHQSSYAFAKPQKGGKGGKGDAADAPVIPLPNVKSYESAMENTVKWFLGEMAKIKVGSVSVEMFSNLPIASYGTVGKAGQVVLQTSTKLVVALYDPAAAKLVVDALKNCGLNLNATVEGNNVNAVIPRPSKESREAVINNASKVAEKAKMDVRNQRKKALDDAKKAKSSHSEDDFRRFTKELETATEKKVDVITNAFKAKEKELLTGV